MNYKRNQLAKAMCMFLCSTEMFAEENGQLARIFRELKQTSNPEARQRILESTPTLQNINLAQEKEAVSDALIDVNPYIRFRCARLLVALALSRPETRPVLQQYLALIRKSASENYYSEWEGAWPQTLLTLIAKLDPKPSEENLNAISLYLEDKVVMTKRVAIEALASLQPCSEVCVSLLSAKLNDKSDQDISLVTMDAIGHYKVLNETLASEILLKLSTGSEYQRVSAAGALGELGNYSLRFRGDLEMLARDKSSSTAVRNAAEAALQKLAATQLH